MVHTIITVDPQPTPSTISSSNTVSPLPAHLASPTSATGDMPSPPKLNEEPPLSPLPVPRVCTRRQIRKARIIERLLRPRGVSLRFARFEGWVGRIGFGAKGIVYGMIGGMTVTAAARAKGHPNGSNESPQGAFILLGGLDPSGALLIILMLALWCYILWRFWEFATAQGADATFGPYKNFFSYRLSPLVSGCVYCAYSGYILRLFVQRDLQADDAGCYPNCWRMSVLGRMGLVLFGVAFTIAAITQLQNALTKKWHVEVKWSRCRTRFEEYLILFTGHVGFLGRAAVFLFVGVLMFKALKGEVVQEGNTLSNGINQLLDADLGGLVAMMAVGVMLVLYCGFALLMMRYRAFPTPPPSGRPLYPRAAAVAAACGEPLPFPAPESDIAESETSDPDPLLPMAARVPS
ncbi:hypothetical protein HKX48_004937 [Thoreauomyces humboldtii]|nr:hypothetical protein HKX48_004937 [Thoreauomyces humboldtii]